MENRHPEEYHPRYEAFLADEIRRSQHKCFLRINRLPYWDYEHDGVNREAEANARARVRALETPKEQLARKTPIIQRPVYQVNRPPHIIYKTEVKPMFKFTVGAFLGLIVGVIAVIVLAFHLLNNFTPGVQGARSTIIVQPIPATSEPVWSNEVIPHPDRPELNGSDSSKEASNTIHHENIELLKDRPEGEGRNR